MNLKKSNICSDGIDWGDVQERLMINRYPIIKEEFFEEVEDEKVLDEDEYSPSGRLVTDNGYET